MTPDYRALCAELLDELELWSSWHDATDLKDRAGAALDLAQPVPEGPSLSDVTELFYRRMGEGSEIGFEDAIAEALARWGHPTPQPVAVSERWPDFSDCDPQERVWAWNTVLNHWKLSRIDWSVHTHWLPANALPTPEATND